MPGHIPISGLFNQKLADLAQEMVSWEIKPRLDEETENNIRNNIVEFSHTTSAENFCMAGVDGSGDYPSLSYADSFVYVATASGTVYRTDNLHGLVELECLSGPNLELIWLPEGSKKATDQWLKAFESLSGSEQVLVFVNQGTGDASGSIVMNNIFNKEAINMTIENTVNGIQEEIKRLELEIHTPLNIDLTCGSTLGMIGGGLAAYALIETGMTDDLVGMGIGGVIAAVGTFWGPVRDSINRYRVGKLEKQLEDLPGYKNQSI